MSFFSLMRSQYDFIILGAGMVGLSIAKQLLNRYPSRTIAVIDKENSIGLHNSGRNSGVLHAGIYYKPDSLKARVCVNGARRLKKWITDRNLPLYQCGKIVIPTSNEEDSLLELLVNRGIQNGASVDIVDHKILNDYAPCARSATNRVLFTPDTCVTNPKLVLQSIVDYLSSHSNLSFYLNQNRYVINRKAKSLTLSSGSELSYGFLINASGIHALDIAKSFSIGSHYKVLPFKGNYWQLKQPSKFNIKSNLYPVPDLNVPFLGIHFTPSVDQQSIYIGPTATPALGLENYKPTEKIDIQTAFSSFSTLAAQYITNSGNMRRYVNDQSFMWSKFFAIRHMSRMIPSITISDIVFSPKVGIRPQLYDVSQRRLEDDLVSIRGESSIHILNAISPAFTASFELADYIISTSELANFT